MPGPTQGWERSISFKVAVTVRYDAGIIDRFRASGDGWQTRMNDGLCDWLKTHRV
ncbi:BrnA antitoxin family protein [Paraburkholderia phenazinium]|uniref:BrnA antitoxin family protein n=1 Tax=Paraburkholderia phenazinium TaxID=60549 RepID=UPI0009F9DBD0|nr:BrnA antitoxin family protein [Paraburkholderia phenazinium]